MIARILQNQFSPKIDPAAWHMLETADQRMGSLTSFSATETQTIKRRLPKPGELTTVSSIRLMRPGFVNIDARYSRPGSEPVTIIRASDGANRWEVFPGSKTFWQSAVRGDSEESVKFTPLIQGFFNPKKRNIPSLEAMRSLDLLREVKRANSGHDVEVEVQVVGSSAIERTVYHIGDSGLVDSVDETLSDDSKEIREELTGIQVNPPMSADSFNFVVAPGMRNTTWEDAKRFSPARSPFEAGVTAPDFSVVTPSNQPLHLSDLRGKVVLVDFWATWCGNCTIQFPHLESLATKNKDNGLVVLAVDAADSSRVFAKYLAEHHDDPHLRFVLDPLGLKGQGPYAKLYNSGIPSRILIDRHGKVIACPTNLSDSDLDKLVSSALAK